ncbi:MAG: hypothetical protein WCJ04_03860 [Actinomycetes bacterium]
MSALVSTQPDVGDLTLKAAEQQRAILSDLAEPGLDLVAAAALIAQLRTRQKVRRERVAGASALLLLVVLAGAWLLLRDSTPESVLADQSEESALNSKPKISLPETTPQTVVPVSPALASPAPSTTAPVVATSGAIAVPATAVPPPVLTSLPNQRLTAQLVLSGTEIEAGSLVEATVTWSDEDLAAGSTAPHQTMSWGDPVVSEAVAPTPLQTCDTPGSPARGENVSRFAYSTPGQYTLRVTLDTCVGQGAYGERVELSQPITVLPARYSNPNAPDSQDVPGQTFAVAISLPSGTPSLPALGGSQASYVPTDTASPLLPLRVNQGVEQFTSSGPAAVLVLPLEAAGRIRVVWTNEVLCAETDEFLLVSPGTAVPVLQLRLVACS